MMVKTVIRGFFAIPAYVNRFNVLLNDIRGDKVKKDTKLCKTHEEKQAALCRTIVLWERS